MNYTERFIVKPGSKVRLSDIDPAMKDEELDKRSAKKKLAAQGERLHELQYRLYAENKHSILVVLQALDAGGKDGTIRHVFGPMNPLSTRVHAFKVPSAEELAHDFLWRIHARVPVRGEVVIFNRSHYEDVLVVRVHELVPKAAWSKRYDLINDFERSLIENDTRILKFFLHISKQEQLKRFKKRLEDPERQWKIAEADYDEREYWDEYQKAYEDALCRTSTDHAPWFVIPADHKWHRNLVVSHIVRETMESMDIRVPEAKVDLDEIRRKYHAEVAEQKRAEE